MNDTVMTTLQSLLDTRGRTIVEHARTLESLLRDLHPDQPQEVSVLIEAIQRGVVTQIMTTSDPNEDHRQVWLASLTEGSGLALRPATWAVRTWQQVLTGVHDCAQNQRSRTSESMITHKDGTLQSVFHGMEET